MNDLTKEIRKGHADAVYETIDNGALETMDNEELKSIFASLMSLRNMDIIHLLARKSHYFPIEMLDVEIKNHNDKDFIAGVLEKYGKKFQYKIPENANRLFEVACKTECIPMLLFLLGKGLSEGEYPRLISGSEKLLKVLDQIKVSGLHPDTIVTFFMEAATSDNPERRIRELIESGFDMTTLNSEGYNACEALRQGIENYPYGKGKQAKAEKQHDLQGLKTLERIYRQQTDFL